MEVNELYQICETTMMILPHQELYYQTKIVDEEGVFLVSRNAITLIEEACLYAGSTLEGRRKAAIFSGIARRRVPIAINPGADIYAYPTASTSAHDCCWIFYGHVSGWESGATGNTLLMMRTGERIEVPVSSYLIERQQQRTALMAAWMMKKS